MATEIRVRISMTRATFSFFILIYFVLFFPIVFPLTSILVPQIMKKNQRNLVSLEIQLGNRL